ncbi:nitroreductase [Lichenihabitans sp. Uapishka_5]|uniref:nitroreductase family protein n=1 Tax=Lichenihabitans sp. Uapishka_5 TaxID=3037302 RepID=UPI0029E7D2A9|nr:nitroreductase [Lichenihabitans sp. Uapishka_5]MDX7953484.1 nitroreductase [Lichenihabitans sp. Uapishka_5]
MTDLAPDTIALQGRRRSVPPIQLAGPGPDAEQLRTLLTVAARVPDHGKLAPWRFIVFEGDARLRAGDALAGVFKAQNPLAEDKRLDLERKRLAQAPLVVAVVSRAAPHAKIPEWEQVMSAGAVCMNLTLAACAMGFATTWLTEWYAYDQAALAALGVEPFEKMAGFIHIGRPAAVPEDRVRPDLDALTTRF